ncbi:Uncharacterized protein Rs2_29713 [Raphanus sativus]|nr:Uncharacterized protein Rs2_29713 [Raphanus sativus]
MVSEDETKFGRMLMEANIEDQSCQTLLSKWDQLKPSMQKAVFLVTKILKEKEFLVLKLDRAEKEVEIVREQNRKLDKENCKLLKPRRSLGMMNSPGSKKRKEKEA